MQILLSLFIMILAGLPEDSVVFIMVPVVCPMILELVSAGAHSYCNYGSS